MRYRGSVRRGPVIDPRITLVTGPRHEGPNELIGVLEVRIDGGCRAAIAERVEVDGRCHIRLARTAWQSKDSLDTRWWSMVLDRNAKAYTIRNGSCGDPVTTSDLPRIVNALESLRLASPATMIALDDAAATFPWRPPDAK
jgi:hypothetical protein